MGSIVQIFRAVGAFFEWLTGRNAARNRPDVVAGVEAKKEQAAVDTTNRAVAKRDTNEIRNELAE